MTTTDEWEPTEEQVEEEHQWWTGRAKGFISQLKRVQTVAWEAVWQLRHVDSTVDDMAEDRIGTDGEPGGQALADIKVHLETALSHLRDIERACKAECAEIQEYLALPAMEAGTDDH